MSGHFPHAKKEKPHATNGTIICQAQKNRLTGTPGCKNPGVDNVTGQPKGGVPREGGKRWLWEHRTFGSMLNKDKGPVSHQHGRGGHPGKKTSSGERRQRKVWLKIG